MKKRQYMKPIGRVWAVQGGRIMARHFYTADGLEMIRELYRGRFATINVVRFK